MNPELYTAAQGLMARELQLSTISNNLANAATDGFRANSTFYEAVSAKMEGAPNNVLNNTVNLQPQLMGNYTMFQEGALKATGQKLDLAIEGQGFFKVQTPDGVRYTRNGSFTLDGQGQVVNKSGYPLLDTGNNPITLNPAQGEPNIVNTGAVFQKNVEVARIGVVDFEDKSLMVPEGQVLFQQTDVNAQEVAAEGTVVAGYLEASNVNVANEMIEMIMAQRIYEANSRVVKSVDREMNQAIIQGLGPR